MIRLLYIGHWFDWVVEVQPGAGPAPYSRPAIPATNTTAASVATNWRGDIGYSTGVHGWQYDVSNRCASAGMVTTDGPLVAPLSIAAPASPVRK